MSTQAKLFITLSKQTVSWTACQGGTGWCVRSVRAASNTAAWPPSLLLLSLLLITPHTQASSPSDYMWSCTWSYSGMRRFLRTSEEVSCLHFRALWHFLHFFSFFSAHSFHLRSTDQAWCSSSLREICKCMCEYTLVLCGAMLHVCVFMGSMWRGGSVGCVGVAASGLWEAGWSVSLTHSQGQPA